MKKEKRHLQNTDAARLYKNEEVYLVTVLVLQELVAVVSAVAEDQVLTEEISTAGMVWGLKALPPVTLFCCCWVKANCWKLLKRFMVC